MPTVKVTLRNLETKATETVTGYPVVCPYLPDYQFAVHHPWGRNNGWRVSELSTGLSVGSRYTMTTKKAATQAFLDRFEGISESRRQWLVSQIQKVQGMVAAQ